MVYFARTHRHNNKTNRDHVPLRLGALAREIIVRCSPLRFALQPCSSPEPLCGCLTGWQAESVAQGRTCARNIFEILYRFSSFACHDPRCSNDAKDGRTRRVPRVIRFICLYAPERNANSSTTFAPARFQHHNITTTNAENNGYNSLVCALCLDRRQPQPHQNSVGSVLCVIIIEAQGVMLLDAHTCISALTIADYQASCST